MSKLLVSLGADAVELSVPLRVAECSTTIKELLADLGEDAKSEGFVLPVPNVAVGTFKRVTEYCEYHLEHPVEPVSDADKYRTDNISDWDKTFIERASSEMAHLFELTMAANYLDIRTLLELCCKHIANLIKGSTPEEVRQKFLLPGAPAV